MVISSINISISMLYWLSNTNDIIKIDNDIKTHFKY